MNTKQRRTARRAHIAKFGAQLVELRLLGARPGLIEYCRQPGRYAHAQIQNCLDAHRKPS